MSALISMILYKDIVRIILRELRCKISILTVFDSYCITLIDWQPNAEKDLF